MKCLVFSDSHGKLDYMRRAVEAEKPDRVFHLGDMARDARQLQWDYPNLPMDWVRGNCDGYSGDEEDPEEREIFLNGNRIWLLHGHTYQVKLGIGMMMNEARARGVQVVLFGHTHTPTCFLEGSLWVMNPGTCSGIPQATYGVIESDGEKLNCRIMDCRPKTQTGEKKKGWFF